MGGMCLESFNVNLEGLVHFAAFETSVLDERIAKLCKPKLSGAKQFDLAPAMKL